MTSNKTQCQMKEMYDNQKHFEDTFDQSNLPEYLLQAQWAEFVELKKALAEIYHRKNYPLSVLDLGVGDGRIIKHFAGIKEIWSAIGRYDGIDVAQKCIDASNKIIKDFKIENKVKVQKLDAVNLNTLNENYDLIISTFFTVGNFYPFDFDIETFNPPYDMSTNDKFTTIISQAYKLLNPNGEFIIGSIYIDNEETRQRQEDIYKNGFGWTVITDEKDCFTATKDGWWSQRFTKQRIFDYLDFVPREKITFIPLDTYEFAMMVRLKK